MPGILKNILKNDFFQGALFLTFANFLTGFLNYLFNSLSAKLLGPNGYSEITSLFAYITIFSVPILILNTDIIKRLGKHGEGRFELFRSWEYWIKTKIKKWGFLIIPYLLLSFLLPRLINMSFASSLTLLIVLAAAIFSAFYVAAFQGLRLFLFSSLIITVPALIKLIGPVFVMGNIDRLLTILIWISLSGILSVVLSVGIASWINKKSQTTKPRKIESRVLQILLNKHFIITILSLLSINLLNNFDIIFVKKFFDARTAGLYGAWSLLGKIIFYIAAPLVTLSLIFFSSREHKKFHNKSIPLITLMLIIGGFTGFFFYQTFDSSILNLIFSNDFAEILPYLPYAAFFGVLYTGVFIFNNYLLAKDSSLSLISAIFFPVYALSLYFWGRNLDLIININILFLTLIALSYLIGIAYNMLHGKKGEPSFLEPDNTGL